MSERDRNWTERRYIKSGKIWIEGKNKGIENVEMKERLIKKGKYMFFPQRKEAALFASVI